MEQRLQVADLVIDRLKKTLFDIGRYGELSDICESILRHDPQNFEAQLTLAGFAEKKGDYETAREILEQLVDDSSEQIQPVLELIRIHLDRGDYKKVGDLCRRLEKRLERRELRSGDQAADTSIISAPQ